MCPFAAPLAKDIKVFTLSVHDALQWDEVDRDLYLCELWAGVGSVSKAAARRKLETSCLDILLLPGCDYADRFPEDSCGGAATSPRRITYDGPSV